MISQKTGLKTGMQENWRPETAVGRDCPPVLGLPSSPLHTAP